MATGLKEVVNLHLKETDEGEDAFARAYSFGISGYRQLMMDVAGSPKSAKIELLANKTAKLPDDYLNYIMIGVLNERGEIATLTENSQLSLYEDCSEDRLTEAVQYNRQNYRPNYYYFANKPYTYPISNTISYGLGSSNTLGMFRIDVEKGLILFPREFRYTHVFIEYLGFPCCGEDDYYVHPFLVETLGYYIYWASIRKKKSIPLSVIREARNEYYNELRKSSLRFQAISRQKLNDLRVHTKLAPKG